MSRRLVPRTVTRLAAAIVVALAGIPVVYAATTSPQVQQPQKRVGAAGAKTQANTTTLQTIVVTATHRAESIQHVAGGITALSGTFLDQIHANSFEQFAGFARG